MWKFKSTLFNVNYGNKDDDRLFVIFPDEHISLDIFEVINSTEPLMLVEPEAKNNCTSTQIDDLPTEMYVKKVTQDFHVLTYGHKNYKH